MLEVIIFPDNWIYDSDAYTAYRINVSSFLSGNLNPLMSALCELDMSNRNIINLATPSSTTDAANKLYVDSLVGRLNVYTRATMPTMPNAALLGAMIYVTDADATASPGCPVYCDGVNWKKVTEKSAILPPP
jgi:hypothetical protein